MHIYKLRKSNKNGKIDNKILKNKTKPIKKYRLCQQTESYTFI